jgi:cytochrome c-type biogenesis protein CcmH/NrfG
MGAQVALIRRLRDLGLLSEALTLHRQGNESFASNALWHAEHAVTLVYMNRIDDAIDHYRRSLDLDPRSPQRTVELAMLLIERRGPEDIDDAQRWADHAFELAPEDPAVLACLAELAALRGDLPKAFTFYQQAIRKLPTDSPQRRAFEQRLAVLGG